VGLIRFLFSSTVLPVALIIPFIVRAITVNANATVIFYDKTNMTCGQAVTFGGGV
jgi:hypothetical protein